jgi:hypothetical protein
VPAKQAKQAKQAIPSAPKSKGQEQSNGDKHKRPPLPTDWSTKEVAEWVGSLGEAYEQYTPQFIKHGVNGKDMSDFDAEDLQETGIEAKSHRKKVLREWAELI